MNVDWAAVFVAALVGNVAYCALIGLDAFIRNKGNG